MENKCFRLTVWKHISFTTKECACNGQLSDTGCTGYFAHTVMRSLTWKGFFGSVWGSHSSWQEVVSVAMWGDWPHCTCNQDAERERERKAGVCSLSLFFIQLVPKFLEQCHPQPRYVFPSLLDLSGNALTYREVHLLPILNFTS